MSIQVDEAFVQQYGTTFRHLAQQEESRFQKAVMVESGIRGTGKTINRLGLRTATRRTTRHGDTPLNDQPHSTRRLNLFDWHDGDMIDEQDKLRMLIDPTSDYMKAMINSMNRAKDDVIIEALGGTADDLSSGTALPTAQKIVESGTTRLTKGKILEARQILRANEADDYNGEELFFAYGNEQMYDILNDTTLTSADFLAVQMLQEGRVGTKWMGFTWIPCERLPKVSSIRYNYAWAKSGITLGVGEDVRTELGKDPSKEFNWRAYVRMSIGAVRTEEEKVVQVQAYES